RISSESKAAVKWRVGGTPIDNTGEEVDYTIPTSATGTLAVEAFVEASADAPAKGTIEVRVETGATPAGSKVREIILALGSQAMPGDFPTAGLAFPGFLTQTPATRTIPDKTIAFYMPARERVMRGLKQLAITGGDREFAFDSPEQKTRYNIHIVTTKP